MIRLIITDLDGTLLDDCKKINPDFWEIERQLTEKGIIFSVASGRQYYNLAEQFDEIKDSLLFLAENGTYIRYKDKEIFVNPLDKASAVKFIETGRKISGAYVVLCGKNSAYVENSDMQFVEEVKSYFKRLEIVDDLTLVEDIILKVTICDFEDAEKNSYLYFKEIENDYKVAVAGKIWLDITNKTANKGTAIEKIQEKFGISYDETLVFGDFLNDLEMMKAARYSYAMKNAHPEILKASRFITEFDNNNNGVLDTIKKLCFNNSDH